MKEKEEDEERNENICLQRTDNQAENREFKHWGHSNPLWIVGGAGQLLYGLNDASRKFWLKVRAVFEEMKRLPGYEAFYYCHIEKGVLYGMISCHMDDYILAEKDEFFNENTEKVRSKLDILKM